MSSRSGTTSKDLLRWEQEIFESFQSFHCRNLITAPPVVDQLAGLQEIETPELKRGLSTLSSKSNNNCSISLSESSGIQNQRTASQSQETKGHDHGIEDQDQNTGSHAQGRGGQGRGTEGLGQETGSRGQKTADQGLRTVNQDTGLGQGTSPGTGEIGQG